MPQGTEKTFGTDYSNEALCKRMYRRHSATIKVQKEAVAVANLVRICEATLKLSNEKGFHASSLRDLSRVSGISMGGLYAYFDNKVTLLTMILEAVTSSAMEIITEPPQTIANDPRAHLRWLIERHVALTEIMQPWFAFAFMEAKSFPAANRRAAVESEAATEAAIARILQTGVSTGVFHINDPLLTAALLKPLLQDWYVKRGKYRKRNIPAGVYARAVCDFVETGVLGQTP
ncbi:TetR/AcrR family transcriptional regulator [Hoeflea sp.]|uniref:TetR/AcrR family transcriptional regulator n=1 Tax=Hoeflea sp. TaxID=1940281 RepID=UPI00199ADC89|nr:TetR/AcrR family transcriptional regulator [Hoeflea sp.]MBC7282194.1 TetR/AcrR family transcriptional regulator [Hoeflea sp.]